MCQSFRLPRALPVQHAGFKLRFKLGLGCRHSSSLNLPDRSKSLVVANVRSLAPVRDHRHINGPVLLSPYSFNCRSIPLRSTSNIVASRRDFTRLHTQHIDSSMTGADENMATNILDTDAKPADILNGDAKLPAGQAEGSLDPESDEDVPVEADELKDALGRPPPVNSSYLPLPWKGRLGYVSLPLEKSNCSRIILILILIGLFEHLPAIFHPSRLLFSNLSYRVNS